MCLSPAELDLKKTHEMFGMNYVVFCLYSGYGERQNSGDLMCNVPLSEGVAKMAAWAKTIADVPQPKRFGHIEVLKNLPPSWAKLA